jgi:hypothetical protein
MKLQVV